MSASATQGGHNNSNNNDNVYGAVIMTMVTARVHPVRLMNAMQTERRVAANPQTKPTDLGCESADKWLLPSASAIAICYYYTQPES